MHFGIDEPIQEGNLMETIINTAKAIITAAEAVLIEVNTYLTEIYTQAIHYKEMYLDPIAKYMSALLSNQLVQMMFSFVKTGNLGLPTFITNPKEYFGEIAEEATQIYLTDLEHNTIGMLSSIRDSVKTQIIEGNYVAAERLRHSTFYGGDAGYEAYFEDANNCPTGDSWDCYFAALEPENDPYEIYMAERDRLVKKREYSLELATNEALEGSGYISLKDCIEKDVDSNCVSYFIKTPGDIISKQLDNYLDNALALLQSADELDELITDGVAGVESFMNGEGFATPPTTITI
ncbi:MAG: hypothetical protein HYT94_03340 [Parcubacteria group bacterium]|nr:hypothetical protein [Parcubacteria group bacterium]